MDHRQSWKTISDLLADCDWIVEAIIENLKTSSTISTRKLETVRRKPGTIDHLQYLHHSA